MTFFLFILAILAFVIFHPKWMNEGVAALVGLLLLLFVGEVTTHDTIAAIVGNELFRPFEIIVILLTLAIISTALDRYGFFRWASHQAIRLSSNDGRKLFRNFFILTVLLTTFTSNDVDVLTIIPVVLWFTKDTQVKPFPYLFSVFVFANTSSMELLFGNLTNIVVADVFGISFIRFLTVMIVPTVVTLLVQFGMLRWMFRRQLSKHIALPEGQLRTPLPHAKKNIYVLSVLALVIVCGAFADILGIALWQVTAMGGLFVLFVTGKQIVSHVWQLPWNVALFALVFIVLTYKFQQLVGVDIFAWALPLVDSTMGAIFTGSIVSTVISGVINNIPASISLSALFYELSRALSSVQQEGLAFGTVIGTNLGALLTPVGALATMLWFHIIRKAGVEVSMGQFLRYGIIVTTVSVGVASGTAALFL